MEENYKELVFRGPTKGDLSAMPTSVRLEIGQALWLAQTGKKGAKTKPLTGPKEFRGAKVLEIVSDDGPNTYRGVYTIEFEEAVYLLAASRKNRKGELQRHSRISIRSSIASSDCTETETPRKATLLSRSSFKERPQGELRLIAKRN